MLVYAFWFAGLALARLQVQNDTFNSSYQLTAAQKQYANLSDALAEQVAIELNYERSNNAGSLTQNDPFYRVPSQYDVNNLPPAGSVLKVEEYTNMTYYNLPATVSMSRFLYVSESLNGSTVPASAYVLWPFTPRKFPGLSPCTTNGGPVYPVVGLAHGTSGQTQACAPSNLRNLWDQWNEPFALALQGYAVVAPDYAGLGIPQRPTPYFVFPSHANDLFHSIEAAQSQWPQLLSRNFVIAGQSQGGGTIWSAAQRQAARPVRGYLGAMAASPFTNVLADINGEDRTQINVRVVGIAQGLDSVLANFTTNQWLTEAGIARLKLLKELVGCSGPAGQLFSSDQGIDFIKPGWNDTDAAAWYQRNIHNSGQPFAGPMLVIQGTADGNAIESVTTEAVNSTCKAFPHNSLQYVRYEGVGHSPVMFAGQIEWLDWIADRFKGVPARRGCSMETIVAGRGTANFVKNNNWFMEWNEYGI
jgi:pimeloyl-ACP methyl ester carboxylesterase